MRDNVIFHNPRCSKSRATLALLQERGVDVSVVEYLETPATAEELQAWVTKHLRSSRAPQQVAFWQELPYNETGKLLRRVVRERLGSGAT